MNATKRHGLRAMLATMAIAVLGVVCTTGAVHAQAHDHGAATPAKLSLDHGRKWKTDAPLRAGMDGIRMLVEPQLGPAHAGKLSTAQYAEIAGKVEREVGTIVANCKLDPRADAMLHLVIAQIGAGTDTLAGKTPAARPEQGLVRIVAAVNDYGRHFEHPGFAPIRGLH